MQEFTQLGFDEIKQKFFLCKKKLDNTNSVGELMRLQQEIMDFHLEIISSLPSLSEDEISFTMILRSMKKIVRIHEKSKTPSFLALKQLNIASFYHNWAMICLNVPFIFLSENDVVLIFVCGLLANKEEDQEDKE